MEPAIQVSPVKEEDMSFVRKVFEDMANNVVAASQLSAQVAEMQRTMTSLQHDVERLKSDVTYYSDQATAFRKKSEDLLLELGKANADRQEFEKLAQNYSSELETTKGRLEQTSHDLQETRRGIGERDDQISKLHDEVEDLREKLAKVHQLAQTLFPTPSVPEVAKPVEGFPEPSNRLGEVQSSGGTSAEPAEAPEPTPSPEVRRAYRNDLGSNYTFDKPYKWDESRRDYYNEV